MHTNTHTFFFLAIVSIWEWNKNGSFSFSIWQSLNVLLFNNPFSSPLSTYTSFLPRFNIPSSGWKVTTRFLGSGKQIYSPGQNHERKQTFLSHMIEELSTERAILKRIWKTREKEQRRSEFLLPNYLLLVLTIVLWTSLDSSTDNARTIRLERHYIDAL